MNGFFEIVAEGAMLDAAVVEKYLLTGINESNIGDYVSDKTYAAAKTIKKLYETVMNAIDEVINKVLNYKDEKMLGFVASQFKKHKFDASKGTVEFRAEVVRVEKFSLAVDKLNKFVSGKPTVRKTDAVPGEDDRAEAEKAVLTKLTNDYLKEINIGNDKIKVESMSDINEAIRSCFISEEAKVVLDEGLYANAYTFIMGRGDASATDLLKNLRELKTGVKREYQALLNDLNDNVKSIKNDANNDENAENIKMNGRATLKLDFNVAIATIIALMGVIKEGVKYCKIMSKAIANKSKKIGNSEDDKTTKGEEVDETSKPKKIEKKKLGEATTFIESALAEAELDLY